MIVLNIPSPDMCRQDASRRALVPLMAQYAMSVTVGSFDFRSKLGLRVNGLRVNG